MNKKKAVLIIAGVLAGLALLVVLFVGAITGFVFYSIGNSEAAQTAKTFLRQNEKLKGDIGEVKGFGSFVLGNIRAGTADGDAELSLKTEGARQTVWVNVALAYSHGINWRVVGASYKNAAGRTVTLWDQYESDVLAEQTNGAFFQGTSDESFEADVLQSARPALVKFTKYSSAEPTDLAPAFESVAKKYAGRVRCFEFYVEDNPATPRRYQIGATPTFVLFEDGEEVGRIAGARTERELTRLLEAHLKEQ